jgi:hypothetical protein
VNVKVTLYVSEASEALVFFRAAVIEPNISGYLPQAWKGAFVVSFVWFLHRWKTNFISNCLEEN